MEDLKDLLQDGTYYPPEESAGSIQKRAPKKDLPSLSSFSKTHVEIGMPFLTAQYKTAEEIDEALDLFSKQFSDGEEGGKPERLIVVDNKGLRLDFWEKEVVTALFCLIKEQGADEKKPYIVIDGMANIFEPILEKKNGRYGGSEREKVSQAFERLKTRRQTVPYYESIGEGKERKRAYFLFDGVLIPRMITTYTGEKDVDYSLKEILEKGKTIIFFDRFVFAGLAKNNRLIPKSIRLEIRKACPEIKEVKEMQIDFIRFLHTHKYEFYGDQPFCISKEKLLKKLGAWAEYRKNKKRALAKLRECFEIAQKVGYLIKVEEDIENRRDGERHDKLYLNADRLFHTLSKKIEAGKIGGSL